MPLTFEEVGRILDYALQDAHGNLPDAVIETRIRCGAHVIEELFGETQDTVKGIILHEANVILAKKDFFALLHLKEEEREIGLGLHDELMAIALAILEASAWLMLRLERIWEQLPESDVKHGWPPGILLKISAHFQDVVATLRKQCDQDGMMVVPLSDLDMAGEFARAAFVLTVEQSGAQRFARTMNEGVAHVRTYLKILKVAQHIPNEDLRKN